MSAPTALRLPELHLRDHGVDLSRPLGEQARSLLAELAATAVFQAAAAAAWQAGDIRAHARMGALAEHEVQLREALRTRHHLVVDTD